MHDVTKPIDRPTINVPERFELAAPMESSWILGRGAFGAPGWCKVDGSISFVAMQVWFADLWICSGVGMCCRML